MASLKEIKVRINSIKSTRKTTSAMKLVASAKLRKAQGVFGNMRPYSVALHHVMEALLSSEFSSSLCDVRPVENVAIVALSSDGSLCGAFNSNIIRETQKKLEQYRHLPKENVRIYTIGKKVYDALHKKGFAITKNFVNLAGKPDYNTVAELADSLITQFEKKEIDRVEILYHHFKSAGVQKLLNESILPLVLPEPASNVNTDYILEPSREELLNVLIPKSIRLQLYTSLLDSSCSEHAARMIAMQIATDNADNLVNELTIIYNKTRQQVITNELLDIVGGQQKR
ncbi:MAG: ATP synthase F1 subunit gamma [Tannerella sp.]|jgi:F-type H+-transporting ATPase subunit gamma|nr:ATP synthase F1 subunit gamma [Tannerella sp.]